MKILCIPYAGSSATTYYKFSQLMNYRTKIVPIEIPGRGIKSAEDLEYSISGIVEAIYDDVLEEIENDEAYVIYGHSMGSLIAYELAYKLLADEGIHNKPRKLLVSGGKAPQLRTVNEENHKLPLDEFKEVILSYGLTTSLDVINDEKILDFFIPIMRADFQAVEEYEFLNHDKLNIDLSCFWGINDKSTKYEEAVAWGKLTNGLFSIHSFPGNHFFIFEEREEFINAIMKEVDSFYYV